jgi:predicted Zn-dependent protease
LIALCLSLGTYLSARHRYPAAACAFATTALLAYGYFRYGTVWLAFRALRAGRSERARALLDQIRFPDRLRSQDRAYYELLRGNLAYERENWASARDHFLRAREHALRTPNDRSMVECALAETLLRCGDPVEARKHLELAREHAHKPELAATIRRVDALIGGSDDTPRHP